MKRTKRIISFLVAFSICVASYCSMGAGNSQVGVTPAEYVQSFMNTTDPDKKLLAGETIEIYDENDEMSGFCVSLTKDGGAAHGTGLKLVSQIAAAHGGTVQFEQGDSQNLCVSIYLPIH